MDRYFLIASTVCFLTAVVHTAVEFRAKVFRPWRFNFFAIGLGFLFQTAFLSVRGHELGRCPITNLFEVFVFLAWSVALIYLLVGPAYRLSLMGAFTAPLGTVAPRFRSYRPDRCSASRTAFRKFVAGVSRIDFVDSLRCVRVGVHRRRDVSPAGTPTQDAPAAFDFLSSAASDKSVRSDHPPAVVGLCALYPGDCERFFYGPSIAPHSGRGRGCALAALCGDLASLASEMARAKTCSGVMHSWV